jgi:hypothetical protein
MIQSQKNKSLEIKIFESLTIETERLSEKLSGRLCCPKPRIKKRLAPDPIAETHAPNKRSPF